MNDFEDLLKKDFLGCVRIWVILLVICFILFPGTGLIQPGEKLQTWFIISIPLGLGGAGLVAFSSQMFQNMMSRTVQADRPVMNFFGQVGGWIGTAGIMYPLIVVVVEFLSTAAREMEKTPR